MTRFFGKVGYGIPGEVVNGVWEDSIVERDYYGDVRQNTRYMEAGDTVLGTLTFQSTVSIVADSYALENFTAIRYVEWAGSLWTVTSVQVQRPRLVLMLGEVWHGPTASSGTTDNP